MLLKKSGIASLLFSFVLSGVASAQSSPAEDGGGYKQAVSRLAAMSTLDLADWRFHADNLPHPERDSEQSKAWQPYKAGTKLNYRSGWICQIVQIPNRVGGYDPTGERVRLQIDVSGSPRMQRIFFNGAEVAAYGNYEVPPLTISESAKPGEKVFVAIQIQRTEKTLQLVKANLLFDTPEGRVDPDVFRQEILITQALLSDASKDDSTRRDQLNAAVKRLDFTALDRGDQSAFDTSLSQAQAKLQPLAAWARQTYSVRAVGNAHMDMAWLWPWTETVEVVRNTYSTVLQLMQQYPEFHYSQSSAQTFAWMEEKYPDIFHEIQERVKEGRWELVGGMWVEPDLNMPDGESLVRQLLVGKRFFREKFGVDVRVGWNPDSFGYNWQLPQIYKKSGLNYFVTQKMSWNDTTVFAYKLFWWQSPDGSRLLTYFPHDYVNTLDPVRIAQDSAAAAGKTGFTELLHLYGVGDHGGGPTREMLDMGLRWRDPNLVEPQLSFGTAQSFFSSVESKVKPNNIPVWKNELYFEKHRGVQTTQSETKRRNRTSEMLALNAEKFASLSTLYGEPYPQQQLGEAWKKILFNQFHDILPGSGIAPVYVDAARDHEEIGRSAREITERSGQVLEAHINTQGEGTPVILFNTLAWKRQGPVEFEVHLPNTVSHVSLKTPDGNSLLAEVVGYDAALNRARIRSLVSLPPMGYEVVHVTAASEQTASSSSLMAKDLTLENDLVRVQVDAKTGCISSLVDKKQQHEAIERGGCGNLLQAFVDKPKEYDAWDIDANFEDKKWDITEADEVRLIENTPTRAVIRVKKHFQNSSFIQDITLYPNQPQVEVNMQVEWHEKHILLKVAFPLAAHNDWATFEIPYGTIQRPTTRRTPAEKAQFEVPALRWADLSDTNSGFSLLNASKYGYDAKGNVLRLSLLRSPEYPDPHADEGFHRFTYVLYPHAGDWKQAGTVRHGYELNYPVQVFEATSHGGELPPEYSFVQLEPANLVMTSMKKAEDDDALMFRFYEFEGRTVDAVLHLPATAQHASETDLMEREQGQIAISPEALEIKVPTGPFEIKTVKVVLSKAAAVPR